MLSFQLILFDLIGKASPRLVIRNFLSLVRFQLILFGQGYYLIFLITLALVIIGIWRESQKYDLYKHRAIPLPIVINIANPADSNKALQSLFNIIETENKYKDHKNNLDQYLNISETDLIFNYSCDIYAQEMPRSFLQILRYNLEKLKKKIPKILLFILPISVRLASLLWSALFSLPKEPKSVNIINILIVIILWWKLAITDPKSENFDLVVTKKGQDRVTIAIDVYSHKINLNDESIENYGDLIYLKIKGSGTIEKNENWLQCPLRTA